jgi:hypothetical protein
VIYFRSNRKVRFSCTDSTQSAVPRLYVQATVKLATHSIPQVEVVDIKLVIRFTIMMDGGHSFIVLS